MSSNLAGRANQFRRLTSFQHRVEIVLSAECPRKSFVRCSRLALAGPQKERAGHATGPPKSGAAPEVSSASDAVSRSTRAPKNSSCSTTLTRPRVNDKQHRCPNGGPAMTARRNCAASDSSACAGERDTEDSSPYAKRTGRRRTRRPLRTSGVKRRSRPCRARSLLPAVKRYLEVSDA